MRSIPIPLFAEGPSHPSVPLGRGPAGARNGGQGRPTAGASRAPFTAASTLAGWRRSGVGSAVALVTGVLSGGVASGAALAQDSAQTAAASVHPYAVHVTDAARRFGIPEAWIWAVMRVESGGNPRAVSPAGAMGLMQIMPATWAELRARFDLGTDPFDVRANITAGAAYLRMMLDRYGNPEAMLAAYSAGPRRYDERQADGRPLPKETRAYLTRLASITGGAGDARLAVATPPPDPLAWRRAALFVQTASADKGGSEAQPNGGIAAAEPTAKRPTDSTAAAIPPLQSAPVDTLFVPGARAGRPQ